MPETLSARNPPKSQQEVFEDLLEEIEELIERASSVLDPKHYEDFVFEAEVSLETFL
jgi:hypothetical protein